MSLVNDMLRDLEQRESKSQRPSHTFAESAGSSRGSAFRYGAISFAVVLGVCAIGLWWQQGLNTAEKGAASVGEPAASAQVSAAVSSVASSSTVADLVSAPVELEDQEPLDIQPTISALQENLIKGKAALLADQLTRPLDASAFLFFQKALSLAPQNPEAIAGLQAIADRYATLALRQLEQGERDGARRMLEKAEGVWPDRESVARVRDQLAAGILERAYAQSSSVASSSASPLMSPPASVSDSAVTQTLASQDRAAVAEARTLIESGKTSSAAQQLHDFLQEQQQQRRWPEQSRRTLLELYLAQNNMAQARGLLTTGLPAEQAAYLQAKIANNEGDYEAAIGHLESALDDVDTSDETYRALMASLYQRLERSASAQVYYTRLLQAFGSKARYWLGLGVAMDRQGDYPAAANAYRRAQSAADTNTTIQNFTRQRLAQLNQ